MYPKTFFANNPTTTEKGCCFVLMPFAEQFNDVYDAIVEALEGPEVNFSCQRADEIFGGGNIIEDILRSLARAEVIIADLTDKNPNVFYELGIAHMVKDLEKIQILTQNVNDIPFDLRHFRYLVYEQSNSGLGRLKAQLIDAIQHITRGSYRFALKRAQKFKFEEQLPGPDNCLYDFELSEVMIGKGFVKFQLDVFRHAVKHPVETVHSESHGIPTGGILAIPTISWGITLERVDKNTAYLCVGPL